MLCLTFLLSLQVSIDLGTGFIPTAVTKDEGDYEIRCSFVDGSTCVGRTLRMPAGQGEGCRDATTGLPLMYGLEAALPVELVEGEDQERIEHSSATLVQGLDRTASTAVLLEPAGHHW